MLNLKDKNIILASNSKRRQQLLAEMGIDFHVITKNVKEEYPNNLEKEKIATYLARIKAMAFQNNVRKNDIIITADTIVCNNNKILGKPNNYDDAVSMLTNLSGKKHEVITGVFLLSKLKAISFYDTTEVYFRNLSKTEISHYVIQYEPYDKAGAYGIQEWIGQIGIEKINGSYFNVVGLPTEKLYKELQRF